MMIQNAISQALHDSQLQTINMLKTFIHSKKLEQGDSFSKVLDKLLEEFACSLKLPKSGLRAKKEPSEFNFFIRDRINEYKKMYPECNGHDLMRMAAAAWKNTHPKNV